MSTEGAKQKNGELISDRIVKIRNLIFLLLFL